MRAGPAVTLDPTGLVDRLRDRGLDVDETWTVRALPGGVSSDVLEVLPTVARPGRQGYVVKQSLPELRVSGHWSAPVERILAEVRALRLAAELEPCGVPPVVDFDDDTLVLTMTRVEPRLTNLREQLLAGVAPLATAHRLGALLGHWHAATTGDPGLADRFPATYLDSLRLDPYYRVTAEAHPDLADVFESAVEELERPLCLVHGDFTPKNVLSDGPDVVVLDWEVAHAGNPVFDLASTAALLLLKAIRGPRHLADLHAFDRALRTAYGRWSPLPEPESLGRHIGCIVLARVDGRSPVTYLDGDQQRRAVALGRRLLRRPGADDPWELVLGDG